MTCVILLLQRGKLNAYGSLTGDLSESGMCIYVCMYIFLIKTQLHNNSSHVKNIIEISISRYGNRNGGY